MIKDSIKVSKARTLLIDQNQEFHEMRMLPPSFYNQLKDKNFEYLRCVLVNVFPDDFNSYCGRIIRQDGRIFKFDLEMNEKECSIWEDVTDEFLETYNRINKSKPWSDEVIAVQLFNENSSIPDVG